MSHSISFDDHFVVNFHCIASKAVSASDFDFSKFCCAFSIAFSHTSVIPRDVANSPGVSFICAINFHSSHAVNLFALVEIFAPFGRGLGIFCANFTAHSATSPVLIIAGFTSGFTISHHLLIHFRASIGHAISHKPWACFCTASFPPRN